MIETKDYAVKEILTANLKPRMQVVHKEWNTGRVYTRTVFNIWKDERSHALLRWSYEDGSFTYGDKSVALTVKA